jgi:hypothetical protein
MKRRCGAIESDVSGYFLLLGKGIQSSEVRTLVDKPPGGEDVEEFGIELGHDDPLIMNGAWRVKTLSGTGIDERHIS